ncbi:hypothetical protein SPONN_2155 [uncultured Candidatus Thioglobus sp.]|nr:hypothetical protein SPONN_2155 [uncultured Candidatus Thioglobus sp.]
MNHIIIGIHGLANKPEPAILKKSWQNAILNGLDKNANMQCTANNFNFHSVYWANKMHKKPDAEYDKYQDCTDKPQRYNDGWIDIIRQTAFNIGGKALDFLKEFNMNNIADFVLSKTLKDLSRYYTNKEEQKVLRTLLKDIIIKKQDKKIVLVAHSMGSIIAYDVLRALGKEYPHFVIDHFITIGSPLGLPHVMHKILEENPNIKVLRTPSIVKNWTNFADKRDPVALDEHLADDYQANSNNVQVKDDLVLNEWVPNNGDTNIHHKSYGYLRTPEFSDIIKTFI